MRHTMLLILMLIVVLANASQASAGALIHEDFWKYQNWMDTAEVPAPPGRIEFHLADCTGMAGYSCAFDSPRHVPDRIYLATDHDASRSVFLHEVGHVYDFQVMRAVDRADFSALVGRAGLDWHYRPETQGGAPTSELFAAAYSDCATNGSSGQYGWSPTRTQHDMACTIIRRASWRRLASLKPYSLS